MPNWINTRDDAQLVTDAQALFTKSFGSAPAGVWAAPGRVNLIGEHVDYAGGLSIPFALEQNTAVAVAPRTDGVLRMVSELEDNSAVTEIPLDKVGPGSPADWSGYVAGSVWAGLQVGVIPTCTGLDIAIVSDVPIGSGLSSSAALECSVALAAFELATGRSPADEERRRLVQACMRAENEVVGASTGGLDQNASFFGKRGYALVLDFRSGELTRVPFDLASRGMVLLIADTNAPHTLSDGQYASRRGVIDAVQHALTPGGTGTIRDIPDAAAAAAQWARDNGEDAELTSRRVRHVVEETARTQEVAHLLEEGDIDGVLERMRDSHISLRDLYQVTTPELDSAFHAAGELGARMTGGGFGGAVIALIDRDVVDDTAAAIASAAAKHGFPEPTFLIARPGEGARRLR
ncbi:galactokinase [Corynebacterium flavescens]|uniref:galactokinase n=1 Tax=Corynebacterium flavescens TaxID=28028 RepID=UPI003FCFEBCC